MTARATLADWRTSPANRWAFHHVRELIPSADIPNDRRRVRSLATASQSLHFDLDGDCDGFIVVQRGRILFEHYANGMTPETPHILFSVSKSMLGLLFGLLELDSERLVGDLVPQVKSTAYRGATLRHLLDMRAGVAFNEDYLASSGPIVEYRKSTGWNALEPGERPSDLHSFYAKLTESDGPHGSRLHYCSPNTDLLGWAIESATGRRYAELVSERLWKPAGAEYPAYITVDRCGAPRTAGGICTSLRDLARVGLFVIEHPRPWIEDLERGGEPQAWAAGDLAPYFGGLPIRYRSQWYVLNEGAPLLFAFGIHGQFLFVERRSELVIAQLSSQTLPMDASRITHALQTLLAIRKRLA